MGIYKVSCEFFVRARDKNQVLEGIGEEGTDFIESHIIVEGVEEMPKNEGIWRDYI